MDRGVIIGAQFCYNRHGASIKQTLIQRQQLLIACTTVTMHLLAISLLVSENIW
jgi:hypothetical protein